MDALVDTFIEIHLIYFSINLLILFVGIIMGGTQSACKVEGVEPPTAATVGRLGNSVSSAISYSVDRYVLLTFKF